MKGIIKKAFKWLFVFSDAIIDGFIFYTAVKEVNMANIIDISAKITNELPVMKITEDIVVTINNRKSTILNIQAMAIEAEKKREENSEYDEMAFINKALVMLVGEKNAKAIEELDLPMPEYKEVYGAIMGVASGTYGDTQTP